MADLRILCWCVGLAISSCVQGASVWKVTNAEHSLYIGGTMHILADSDYPLPEQYQTAYTQAHTLVFETDLQEAKSAAFQQQSLQALTYQDGRDLTGVLQPATLQKLGDYLRSHQQRLQDMINYKASLVAITLSMMEFKALGLNTIGVDEYFAKQARKDHKQQIFLETPQQQLDFLKVMGENNEDQFISYTLQDLQELPEQMLQIKSYWREGDMQNLAKLSLDPFIDDYADIYQALLVKRNLSWIAPLEQMLDSAETEFVLVGALHLAGPHSVLQLLADKGYKIEKLP